MFTPALFRNRTSVSGFGLVDWFESANKFQGYVFIGKYIMA